MQLAYKSLSRKRQMPGRYDVLQKEAAPLSTARRAPSQKLAVRYKTLELHLRKNDFRPTREWWGPPKEDKPLENTTAPSPPPPPKPAPKGKGASGALTGAFRAMKGLLVDEDEPLPPSTLGGETQKNDRYWRTLDL